MSNDQTNSGDFTQEFENLLAAARQGCERSMGELLTGFRDYLLLVAKTEMPGDLRAKVGDSDVVEETLLAAQRNFCRFEGRAPAQLLGWLKAILAVRIAEINRNYRQTLKRDISRESSLVHDCQAEPRAVVDSPSAIAVRTETHEAIERALASLPSDYRRVIVLRNLENRSFVDIARELGRSPDATRKLWFRAIVSLQKCYGGMQDDG
jgi:RNA polymerase sigma-70 factor, ECF subfamily